jgi:hypothetical protein
LDINPRIQESTEGDLYSSVEYKDILKTDLVILSRKEKYDCVITNPPYLLAFEIAVRMVLPWEHRIPVMFLLRLNWASSQKRNKWLLQNQPSVYVLGNRPSFTGGKGADATDYAWFVWGMHASPRFCVLPSVDKKIRKLSERQVNIQGM